MKNSLNFAHSLLCISLLVLLIVILPGSEANRFVDFFRNLFSRTCRTPECVGAASMISNNTNQQIDPCEDFYDFACGGWIEKHPLLPNETRRDQFRELQNITDERIKEILDTEDLDSDPESLKDARRVYRACLGSANRTEENMEFLLERLAVWGGWPMASEHWDETDFDWKALMVDMLRVDDISPLFSITVGHDRKNASTNMLVIDQADVGICPLLSRSDDSPNDFIDHQVEAWIRETVHIIASATNQTLSLDQLERDVEKLILMDRTICSFMPTSNQREDQNRMYNPTTLKILQKRTNAFRTRSNGNRRIHWFMFLRDFMNGTDVDIDENERVMLREPSFIFNVISLIYGANRRLTVDPRSLANFLLWKKIIAMEATPELRQLQSEFETNTNFGSRGTTTCVDFVREHYEHAIGYAYVKLHLDEEIKEKTTELAKHIRDSFVNHLREINWMDAETRVAAIEKAENMLLAVGYPDWYDNFTLVSEFYSTFVVGDFHMENKENLKSIEVREQLEFLRSVNSDRESKFAVNPTQVNAFYIPEYNTIGLPAAIFQPPFYVKGRPEAMNYGSIGAIVGHEMSHAFDIGGRHFDKFGDLNNWWSEKTVRAYISKTDCMEKQYAGFEVDDFRDDDGEAVLELDGVGTISENIADNGGLQEALGAYRKYVEAYGRERKLPGLTKYSAEQLFFIGFATNYCETFTRESLEADIQGDIHTPSKYRVLIPLANSPEFDQAWNCKRNANVNLTKRCIFW